MLFKFQKDPITQNLVFLSDVHFLNIHFINTKPRATINIICQVTCQTFSRIISLERDNLHV